MKEKYLKIDPYILLSVVNTKLRDYYTSLQSLCDDLGIDLALLVKRLKEIGYIYDLENRQFKLVSN
ncbi:MAG: DUF4250 domain-containing protein [Tenericutes bacterium HGW-Tenericutes-5]|jgi:hypothetical protein|nr:MAG: DUF4250 domain-containing protein [Tenericutes bacterium HGW-Tenericutes-5]